MSLLPRARALDQRPFVLDGLDSSVVAGALCRLEVLLGDGVVVLIGGTEARRYCFVFVGQRLGRCLVPMLVMVRRMDDAG